MGNSTAYPVFRTTDATTAYRQAERLCALLVERADEVWLTAESRTVEDVRRIAAVLPGANFDYSGMRTGPAGEWVWFDLDVTTADDGALEPHLPLDVMERVPRGSVEERFVAALGQGTAAIDWHGLWSHAPEADRYSNPEYDGVQVVFYGDDAQWGHRAEHHTVFVHGSGRGLARAEELAALIGGEVLGPPQPGW